MKLNQLCAVLAIATAAGAAVAVEAEQFNDTPSTLTREEVKADLAKAKADGTLMSGGEATVFVDRPVASVAPRNRDDVREEARVAARAHAFNDLYVGAI